MKWIRFAQNGVARFGVLAGETVSVTDHSWADVLNGRTPQIIGEVPLSAIKLLAPVAETGKIVAIGLNYLDHCRETNTPPPERPLVFTKFTTAINHPDAPITWSTALTQEVDFEAEHRKV